MWFLDTLRQLGLAAAAVIAICAIAAFFGSLGFQLRRAIRGWPHAGARYAYSLGTSALLALAAWYFRVPVLLMLVPLGIAVAGWFGFFIVPGDESVWGD